jgi:hypothetical protein
MMGSLQMSSSTSDMKSVEMPGPVYPVDTKHSFPPETPKREEAPGHDDLKHPVYGVDGKHSFREKTPAPLEQNLLTGPVKNVEHHHKFGSKSSTR